MATRVYQKRDPAKHNVGPSDGLVLKRVAKPQKNPLSHGPYKVRRLNRTIRTPENAHAFLEELAKHGIVKQACLAIGQDHHTRLYEWRREDPEFKAAWDEAAEIGVNAMEDEAKRRAFESSDILMMFLLKAARPEKYREPRGITNNVGVNVAVDIRSMPVEDMRKELSELMQREPELFRRPMLPVAEDEDGD